jgi:predicted MFS family arabinose efflux permease
LHFAVSVTALLLAELTSKTQRRQEFFWLFYPHHFSTLEQVLHWDLWFRVR